MATYIFDLQSPCNNGEQYQVEVKITDQTLEDDFEGFDQESNDLECAKRDHHEESPFLLDIKHQSQRIDTPSKEICYRVDNSPWKRVKAKSPYQRILV